MQHHVFDVAAEQLLADDVGLVVDDNRLVHLLAGVRFEMLQCVEGLMIIRQVGFDDIGHHSGSGPAIVLLR